MHISVKEIWRNLDGQTKTRIEDLHGMCYPVCGIVHIKDPLLLIRKKVAHVLGAACLKPYNHK